MIALFWLNPAFAELSKDDVSKLQARLMVAEYYDGKINGILDEKTLKASIKYLGLGADAGIVAPQLALKNLRKEQKINVDFLTNAQQYDKFKKILYDDIEDTFISNIAIWIALSTSGLVGSAWLVYVTVSNGIKEKVKYGEKRINKLIKGAVNKCSEKASVDAQAMGFRSQGKTLDFTTFLFWKMVKYYKESDFGLYEKLLKVQLEATRMAEVTGKAISEDTLLVKLSLLANCAYYYVDQESYPSYYRDARNLYPILESLLSKVDKEKLNESYCLDIRESIIFIFYKLINNVNKSEELQIVKSKLLDIFILKNDEDWITETKSKYLDDINFD